MMHACRTVAKTASRLTARIIWEKRRTTKERGKFIFCTAIKRTWAPHFCPMNDGQEFVPGGESVQERRLNLRRKPCGGSTDHTCSLQRGVIVNSLKPKCFQLRHWLSRYHRNSMRCRSARHFPFEFSLPRSDRTKSQNAVTALSQLKVAAPPSLCGGGEF